MSDDSFQRWMAATLGITGARLGDALSGGNANVTRIIGSDFGKLIYRSPPRGAAHETSGGLKREYRILKAADGRVPAPRALGYCDDPSITGSPFLISTFIPGLLISTSLPPAYSETPNALTAVGFELIDTLAAIHQFDWHGAGLSGLAKTGNYVERQVRRWLDVRAADAVRDLPLLTTLSTFLLKELPQKSHLTLIHGDYHLENVLFAHERPQITGVIDWELATIGDPLTDLALFLMFWGPKRRHPPAFAWVQQSTRRPDAIAREQLAERWSQKTGIGIDRLDYYKCFAFWRMAAVVEGAYVQFRRGLMDTAFARGLEQEVPALLEEAAQYAAQ